MKSGHTSSPNNPDLLRQVVNGPFRDLRAIYESTAKEETPERFKRLLDQLR